MPGWTFDDDALAKRFEKELRDSIPNFEAFRQTVTLAVWSRNEWTARPLQLLDIGASHGGQIKRLLDAGFSFTKEGIVALEPSRAMHERLVERFGSDTRVRVSRLDLESYLDRTSSIPQFDVVIAAFVFQFIPVEKRSSLLYSLCRCLKSTSMMIFAEKVLPENPADMRRVVDAMHETHVTRVRGVDPGVRADKKRRLENVMVPMSARANESMLIDAGFDVDVVWAAANFRAWACVPRQ